MLNAARHDPEKHVGEVVLWGGGGRLKVALLLKLKSKDWGRSLSHIIHFRCLVVDTEAYNHPCSRRGS